MCNFAANFCSVSKRQLQSPVWAQLDFKEANFDCGWVANLTHQCFHYPASSLPQLFVNSLRIHVVKRLWVFLETAHLCGKKKTWKRKRRKKREEKGIEHSIKKKYDEIILPKWNTRWWYEKRLKKRTVALPENATEGENRDQLRGNRMPRKKSCKERDKTQNSAEQLALTAEPMPD